MPCRAKRVWLAHFRNLVMPIATVSGMVVWGGFTMSERPGTWEIVFERG